MNRLTFLLMPLFQLLLLFPFIVIEEAAPKLLHDQRLCDGTV